MAFVEADGHAFMRGEEDDLVAVGDAASYEFVAVFDSDGVDSVRAHVHEFTQLRFLHETIAGSKEDVLVLFFELPNCAASPSTVFAPLHPQQGCHWLPFTGKIYVGTSYTFSQYTRPLLVKIMI